LTEGTDPGFAQQSSAAGGAPSEQELREAYEQQIKQVRVEQILIEEVVTIINLGMRRTGLAPGTEDERDPDQVRVAVESVRALLPILEQIAPEHLGQIRDALSQLQMAYVRLGGQPSGGGASGGAAEGGGMGEGGGAEGGGTGGAGPAGGGAPGSGSGSEPASPASGPGEPGPAQRSGRLWVPGQ
jgi:hypothetical protein